MIKIQTQAATAVTSLSLSLTTFAGPFFPPRGRGQTWSRADMRRSNGAAGGGPALDGVACWCNLSDD